MVAEHRDSPHIEPDEAVEEIRASPSRRFASLVASPAARRLSPRRLAWAVSAGVLALAIVTVVGARVARSVTDWVGSLPDYQLPFERIELVPAPPAYIRPGAAGLLEQVRVEARHGEALPLLGLDLKALENDFRRNPWVKDVTGVGRSFGQLTVHLVYRKPVAVAEFDKGVLLVVDEDGVILPLDDKDVDWIEKGPKFRARGLAEPLIVITDVKPPREIRPGLVWMRGADGEAPDLQLLGAARLAKFLQEQGRKTPGGRATPEFVAVQPEPESTKLFLRDSEMNLVFWDDAPGSEARGGLTAAAKWAMLLDWVDRHGSIGLAPGEYLRFGHAGAKASRFHQAAGPKRARGR